MGAKKKPQEKPQPKNPGNQAGGKGGGKGGTGGKTGKKDHPPVVTGKPAKPKGAQKITVQHILCSKESKAKEALAKIAELRDAAEGGRKNLLEIFSAVAREYDEDKPRNAGRLGEMTKDKLDPDFAKVAFELRESTAGDLQIGQARTGFGYHLIIVTKRL
ncbi:hypothetical protein DL769_005564 [Monosporascus sp. CRB-8-3]|nr:hypothetical protein DL769_005564 [Monosporascus sp. CRB-8-3]